MSGPFGSTAWMANPASGFYDFNINNSLRLESASETLLEKTNAGSGGSAAQIATLSCWFKYDVSDIESSQMPLIWNDSDASGISLAQSSNTPHQLYVYWGGQGALATTMKFRDPSAWYHVVAEIDSTQGTEANRLKLYVNGVSTAYSGSFNQNTTSAFFNNNVKQRIGEDANNRHFGGYVTDINAIEGTAYAASHFGETKNDIWVPKDPSVTYGTNGFRLQFKSSAVGTASASTIGADTSGNTNHFTSTNIGVHDQVPDSPTNNFATINSVKPDTTGAQNHSFSEGNLKVSTGSNAWWNCFGTIGMSSGKYYWEYYALGDGTVDQNIGVCTLDWHRGSNAGADSADAYSLYAASSGNGNLYTDGANAVNKGSGYHWSWGDIMSVAFDADSGKIYYAKNGTFLGSGDPAAGSNAAHTVTAGDLAKGMLPVFSGFHTSGTPVINFGQDSSFAGNETAQGNKDANGKGDFYYSPPAGYVALCTANLPDPVETIDPNEDGSVQDYFQTKLYTGNGNSSLDIDLDFTPDFVWIKRRGTNQSYVLADKLRGDDKFMATNGTGAEETDNTKFRNFLTNSFRVGSHNGVNNNGSDYLSWNIKANGSGSSNTDGSLNTTATSVASHQGFSISTYTGTGSSTTIGHGLGGVPNLILIKQRNEARDWYLYNSINAGDGYLYLNHTSMALETDQNRHDRIGNTSSYVAPTTTVITLGTSADVNKSSATYVMYCFRNIEGYQKIGTYTGNGNASGPHVYTGFRPAFVLVKRTNTTGDWLIYDSERYGFNDKNSPIYPAEDIAEGSGTQSSRLFDILSNGFKPRTDNANLNNSGDTYLFWAIAKQPFKYANAR